MLSKPSKELARRILSGVDYEHRIGGTRLHERAGVLSTTMYSFSELVAFLSDPYPCIDLGKLKTWIGGVMQDHELQTRIGEVIAADASEHTKIKKVRDLAGLRLMQCRRTI